MLSVKNERGSLFAINNFDELPFLPKRLFVVSDVPSSAVRGKHAHYETQQVLFCLKGSIQITITDKNGVHSIFLSEGEKYFHDRLEWAEIDFENRDTLMLVVCSTDFDEDDYIRDLEQFKGIISLNKGMVQRRSKNDCK